MQFKDTVLAQIASLPNLPGIYIFRALDTRALYVGKAKDLKKRVASYLREDFWDWKIENLRQSADSLDYQTTQNELGALILEAKMIEALQPPFNIKLKAQNPFLYFHFSDTPKDTNKNFAPANLPRLELVREPGKEGIYYGPFLNKKLARELFDLLTKTFGLRICSRKIANGCLYYHLGQCAGQCLADFDQAAYLTRLQLALDFFKQGPRKFITLLAKKIAQANEALRFEEASLLSRYHYILQESALNLQQVSNTDFLLAQREMAQHVWLFDEQTQLIVLLENRHHHLEKKGLYHKENFLDMTLDEILCAYYRENPPPLVIYVNFSLQDRQLVLSFLKAWYKQKIAQEVVVFGSRPDNPIFLDLALQIFAQEVDKFCHLARELQAFLSAPKPIVRIDCFDVSHHQELCIVASCVRFANAQPNVAFYRHFKVVSTTKPNDYQSLREVVTRRYQNEEESICLI